MELFIQRTYTPTGTNGDMLHNGSRICHTIELPWNNNIRRESCIPEGRYPLRRFPSKKHGMVVEVCNVPNRDAILLHKANYALVPKQQLNGCIAPVMQLEINRPGVGWLSGKALPIVLDLCFAAFDRGEEIFLTITKK